MKINSYIIIILLYCFFAISTFATCNDSWWLDWISWYNGFWKWGWEISSYYKSNNIAILTKTNNIETNNIETNNTETNNTETNNTEINNTETNNIETNNTEINNTETNNTEVDNIFCSSTIYKATLTNYNSYPEAGSEEAIMYNWATWEWQFYWLSDKKAESWVKANNIVAVHLKDWWKFWMKTLKLKQWNKEIMVKAYDACSDSDCDDCCTKNLWNNDYLIDIEEYTMQRFGSWEWDVEFQICDEWLEK